jgi:hypothetical protein
MHEHPPAWGTLQQLELAVVTGHNVALVVHPPGPADVHRSDDQWQCWIDSKGSTTGIHLVALPDPAPDPADAHRGIVSERAGWAGWNLLQAYSRRLCLSTPMLEHSLVMLLLLLVMTWRSL